MPTTGPGVPFSGYRPPTRDAYTDGFRDMFDEMNREFKRTVAETERRLANAVRRAEYRKKMRARRVSPTPDFIGDHKRQP